MVLRQLWVLVPLSMPLACFDGARRAEPGVIPPRASTVTAGRPVDAMTGEPYLANLRQLTFVGENTAARWAPDGSKLIVQSRRPPDGADQVLVIDLQTGTEKQVSRGDGAATAADATVCPVTGRIAFTSDRDGDPELYSMEPDGTDVRRLTERAGYDGRASYARDGTRIVLQSGGPGTDAAQQSITLIDRDGGGFRTVTDNGMKNTTPSFHPDNRRILFASDQDDPTGRDFEIYMIDADGGNQVRITNNPSFDGCPSFSPDGRYLAFTSRRHAKPGETHVFVAEWIE